MLIRGKTKKTFLLFDMVFLHDLVFHLSDEQKSKL
jgi:hypothetical protein